jgi:hypothetical protein
MINLAAGLLLLATTVGLFLWVTPKEGQPSRVPDRWGLGTMVPILILCLGIAGCVLVAKGIYP